MTNMPASWPWQWVFYYPDLDSPCDIFVNTTDRYPGRFGDLWNLAKAEDDGLASRVGRAWPTLYIPSDLSYEPSHTLLSRSRDWLRQHRDNGQIGMRAKLVTIIFPDGPFPANLVHVLVATEELLESLDDVGEIGVALKRREKGIKTYRNSFMSPSSGVGSFTGVGTVVKDAKETFHAGRPATNFGPPVSLFNHALGMFDYRLHHLDSVPGPHPSLIQQTHSFMHVSANSYANESERTGVIREYLDQIFGLPLIWEVPQARFGTRPNVINVGRIPFLVVELKNEAGLEGDASLQAALSYAHIATSPLDPPEPSKYPAILSNYPAVLYGIMGNLLEIGVAAYTDGPYYNLLFSERLYLGFYTEENVLRLARAFAATRLVLEDLRKLYAADLPARGSIEHLFPAPLPVPGFTGSMPSLTFTHRLSRSGEIVVLAEDEITRQSGIYFATMDRPCDVDRPRDMTRPRSADVDMTRPRSADEDTVMSPSSADALADTLEVVVKFTVQYHAEAHRLLANKGLAPVLHACVPVCGGLFMVVMDRVNGEPAFQASARQELLPYKVYEDIRDAVQELHVNNLVFGDLRTPNIMVVRGGSGSDTRSRGMLVDFDWVGTHGIGRYPASLNASLPDWLSTSILRYGIMDKAHDVAMLEKFRHLCHSD